MTYIKTYTKTLYLQEKYGTQNSLQRSHSFYIAILGMSKSTDILNFLPHLLPVEKGCIRGAGIARARAMPAPILTVAPIRVAAARKYRQARAPPPLSPSPSTGCFIVVGIGSIARTGVVPIVLRFGEERILFSARDRITPPYFSR